MKILTKENEEPTAVTMVARLFLGLLEKSDMPTNSHIKVSYPTQQAITEAISVATDGKLVFTQSAISKALRVLTNEPLDYKGKIYYLEKINGAYQLLDRTDVKDQARHELESSDLLDRTSSYCNNSIGISTCYGFKIRKVPKESINDANIKKIIDLFQKVLGEVLFEWIQIENTIFLYLDASKDDFRKESKWLSSLSQ